MANPENLIGHEFTSDQSREQAARNGRKGGIASGAARRKRKAMAEAFDELLSRQYSGGADGVTVLAAKVFQRALDGDMKAVQFVRDTVGEMPVQRLEVDTIDPQARERVERILSED